MEKLSVTLSVTAWNIVLQALIQRPYIEVYEIVEEIKKQEDHSVNDPEANGSLHVE